MDLNDPKWVTVSDSEHPHEREALAWFRRTLPNSPVTRAWSNFSFTGRDGRRHEVDLLLVTPAGFWLVEFKAHPGSIAGDGSTWQWEPTKDRFKQFDNPRILAEKKAKILKSLLGSTKAVRSMSGRLPFLQELVFLSDPAVSVRQLNTQGRHAVFGRDASDGQDLPAQRESIGGIVEHVSSLDPDRNGRPRRRVDRPTSEAIAAGMNQIGIRELTSRRTVGDYQLQILLEDVDGTADGGITYQDFTAKHSSIDLTRRMRIYPLEHNATDEANLVARRAARREFELLSALDHPAILRPVDYLDSDRGPALLFDYDEDAAPLHHWLASPSVAEKLKADHRLALIRQIAEAVHHAHQRGVSHRNLAPSTVLVSGEPGAASVKVTNWHAGARIGQGTLTTSSATRATKHGTALSTVDASFYRAPEHAQEGARSSLIDVFSLGALAALIMTDNPPARTVAAFDKMLLSTGYVDASAIGDSVDGDVVDLIADATAANPGNRLQSVGDLLAGLDLLDEERRRSDEIAESTEQPISDAKKGDFLGGGRFEVLHRLGSGSTAFALQVRDHLHDGRMCVLKVASTSELNGRLDDEASALESLRHPRIVELLDTPIEIDDRRVLVLSFAGQSTLAARLADQPGAELAERFGHDLLDALVHLEERGVSHRDIKPENIGVVPTGARDELRAVLFDFSLSRAGLEAIDAGTQGYVDPFLKGRGRWDLHADRYSAAVTLFEMAAGTRPRYGDGAAHPATVDDAPTVEPTMFEPAVAAGLTDFFVRALAREVAERFDTATDMLRAWDRAFESESQEPATKPAPSQAPSAGNETPAGESADDAGRTPKGPAPVSTVPADDVAATGIDPATGPDTPLVALDVSRKAINACERLSVSTAGELALARRGSIRGLRGIGARTKKELLTLNANLTAFFRATGVDLELPEEDPGEPTEPADTQPTGQQPQPDGSLIAAALQLLPSDPESTPYRALNFILDFPPDPGRPRLNSSWPAQSQPAEHIGVSSGRIAQILTDARSGWQTDTTVTSTRALIAEELATNGGLASIGQLTAMVARAEPPGSADDLAEHTQAAGALVRAALYAERGVEQSRWDVRRRDEFAVVAAEALEGDEPSSQTLADFALGLARATDAAVEQFGVVDSRRLKSVLADVDRPAGSHSFDDGHLVELATDISSTTAMNARLEAYRAGMSARLALQACRRSFVGVEQIEAEEIVDRVRTRFPEAERVPGRPELDQLLEDVGVDLEWSGDFFRRPPEKFADTATGTTFRRSASDVPGGRQFGAIDLDEAAEFERALSGWTGDGSLRVLVTSPRNVARAATKLDELEVSVVDFDELLLDQLIAATSGGKPSWEVVTRADAGGPAGPEWANLQRLLDREFSTLTDELFASDGTVVLHSLGLLARYDRVNQIALWRERLQAGNDALRGLWLLIPGGDNASAPMLGNDAVPVVASGYWRHIPRPWLPSRSSADAQGSSR